MRKILLLTISVFTCYSLLADVRLPNFFGDNMVLQRDKPIPVWGWASPKEKITVQFGHQIKTTKADKTGKWMIVSPCWSSLSQKVKHYKHQIEAADVACSC